jgi:6-pyruvoyltetrahydropterin/6-carboxytetrahydropterin synthase
MKIGLIETIDSAHHLPGHETCGKPHGHTYTVELVLEGESKDGMIMDFKEARNKAKEILKKFDHVVLNDLIKYPSCENICETLFKEIKAQLPMLVSLKLWEGKNKWAEMSV